MNDICANVVQETLVVRNYQQCLLPGLEVTEREKEGGVYRGVGGGGRGLMAGMGEGI